MASANGKMKRHEACYWLNILIEEERRSIKYQQEQMEATARTDYITKEVTQLSEDEISYNRRHGQDRIDVSEKKLLALDIAADALTAC